MFNQLQCKLERGWLNKLVRESFLEYKPERLKLDACVCPVCPVCLFSHSFYRPDYSCVVWPIRAFWGKKNCHNIERLCGWPEMRGWARPPNAPHSNPLSHKLPKYSNMIPFLIWEWLCHEQTIIKKWESLLGCDSLISYINLDKMNESNAQNIILIVLVVIPFHSP